MSVSGLIGSGRGRHDELECKVQRPMESTGSTVDDYDVLPRPAFCIVGRPMMMSSIPGSASPGKWRGEEEAKRERPPNRISPPSTISIPASGIGQGHKVTNCKVRDEDQGTRFELSKGSIASRAVGDSLVSFRALGIGQSGLIGQARPSSGDQEIKFGKLK